MHSESMQNNINRRHFLARLIKAGGCAAAACGIGFGLHTRKAPGYPQDTSKKIDGLDFSMGNAASKICVARGGDRLKTLRKALKAMGTLAAFIKKGDRVLLKVNAAFATPPIICATTHPDLVAEMARMCFNAGASSVTVTDNPINDPTSCFQLTGIRQKAEAAGAKILVPGENNFEPISLSGGKLIQNWPVLFEPLEQADKLIGMAPVKDHHRSGASMSMKNWYGLLGGRRNVFHQDVHNIIKELALMVKPTLVVLDGTATMMQNGPTGGSLADLKPTDTMIVATDQVAADAFGATLLERSPESLAFIKKAEAAGAGTSDWQSLDPIFI